MNYPARDCQRTMSMPIPNSGGWPYTVDGLATAVLDSRGTVLQWTGAAADLTGLTAREVCGRPVQELLADLPGDPDTTAEILASGQVRLRHQSGDLIRVTFRATQVAGSANILVVATPARAVSDQQQGVALLRALSSQDRIGIVLHDLDLVVVHSNNLSRVFGCPPCRPVAGCAACCRTGMPRTPRRSCVRSSIQAHRWSAGTSQ
jgi:PAS domain S-box-containing protein